MRPIDADALYQTEKLLGTNIVRRDKVASELLEQILYDIQHFPTLTPQNEWVSVEERLSEHGRLIVYANKFGNEALYGVLRVPKNERPDRYDYWMYLQEVPDRRPERSKQHESGTKTSL